MRLDLYISHLLQISRNRAGYIVECGLVQVDGAVCTRLSQHIADIHIVEVTDDIRIHWVSRSAKKLYDFLVHTPIQVAGSVCLDIGASTGGWTQVLLDAGATQVHAVEVGTAQLDASIYSDARVHSYEKIDIRTYALQADIPDFDIIVGDISFISLCEMIPTILSLASIHTHIVLLFKPQFEVHTTHLTRSGIPKKQEYIDAAWTQVCACIHANDGTVVHTAVSTLAGEAGNVEKLLYIRRKESWVESM